MVGETLNLNIMNFDIDRLRNVLTYYDVQEEYKSNNKIDITFDEETYEEFSTFPVPFNELSAKNNNIGEIFCDCCDDYPEEKHVGYWFDINESTIMIAGTKFTMKEAITIINLVMEQQMADNGHCYEVTFGSIDEDDGVLYHQEATAFGLWWDNFIKYYQEKMEKIENIGLFFDNNHQIDIVFYLKTDNE